MAVSGTFYVRTWEGAKEKWKAIGTDPSQARMAVVRKEREFNGGGRITGSKTLREAIDVFLAEHSVQQRVSIPASGSLSSMAARASTVC